MNLLSQLRDIHSPPAISVWPLAMGWYVFFGFLVCLIGIFIYLWVRHLKKHYLKKVVLKRIEELQLQKTPQVAEELSILLKRAALAIFPRKTVAGLHGEEWLRFLDKTALTNEFTEGVGRLLIIYPYQQHSPTLELPDQFFHLLKQWVKKNL